MIERTSVFKCYCNLCMGERNHTCLFTKTQRDEELDDDGYVAYSEMSQYILAECNGCESISLVVHYDHTGAIDTIIDQYPPRRLRKEPKWLFNLMLSEIGEPHKYDFLKEIYTALTNNAPRLAVIGIRSLLEHILIEKSGDQGNFYKNLDKFLADGHISAGDRDLIGQVIEAGHASVHRKFVASKDDIDHLLDVTETLLARLYIHQDTIKRMHIPPRVKRNQP